MIRLSYLVSTRNKISSIKDSMNRLILAKQADEEIVVVDGGSTDGGREYLEGLYRDGKIDQFISEPDFGESHAFNKAFLMARGELLKLITDDDYFLYSEIQACKEFMLEHPQVDLLATNGAKKRLENASVFGLFAYDEDYRRWLENKIPFSFCGLGLMLRKKSLPLIGLLDPEYVKTDAEFSLRVTSGKASLAWYTGITYIHIAHPQGNTITKHERIYAETVKLDYLYFRKSVSLISRGRRAIMKVFKMALPSKKIVPEVQSMDVQRIFESCDQWVKKDNRAVRGRFLYRS